MVKKCPECNHYISDNVEICPHCGAFQKISGKTPLKVNSCPHCGAVVNMGDTFCSNCGKKLEDNDKPYNETSLKEKESIPDNYNNLSTDRKTGDAKNFRGYLPYIISAIILILIGMGIWWYSNLSNNDSVKEEASASDAIEVSPITMNYGGWIGGENCSDFQVEGTSGYYLLTPENHGGVKRTLSLETFNPNTGECVINAYLRDDYIGKFEGKVANLEKQDGRYLCHSFSGAFISVKGARLDFSLYSVGLTFRTFTERKSVDGNDGKSYTVQSSLGNERTVANLKQLGFKLVNSKTEKRPDYTGEEYEEVTIETFSKVINGNTTTVILESDYTEIHFSNLQDVEIFKQTSINCGLKNKGNELEDISQIYWDGTNVTISGTTVKLEYRWEA